MSMGCSDNQADAEHAEMWPALEAVLHDIEDRVAADAIVGDPTAPWEGIDDQAVVTISGAVLKVLCEITAQADGAMEWGQDQIILHSGISAPVPLRFYVRPPLSY
jgi:hypothetical protein